MHYGNRESSPAVCLVMPGAGRDPGILYDDLCNLRSVNSQV